MRAFCTRVSNSFVAIRQHENELQRLSASLFIQSAAMLRREIRERRELIYRKTKEQKVRALQERREIVRDAIEYDKPLPADLRRQARELIADSAWGESIDSVDDEYRWAGCADPKIVVTTSRDPSASLKRFVKVCAHLHAFPL